MNGKHVLVLIALLNIVLAGPVHAAENGTEKDMDGLTEEEWAIIEQWEILEDLDFFKEDLNTLEAIKGDDHEE